MSNNVQGAALADGDVEQAVADPPGAKPMTRNEKRIYQELRQSGVPMKAYALLENLQDEGIRAPMTVYRALDALIERGVVKKVASLNAFAAVQADAAQSIGAFVTCRHCGKTRWVNLSETLVKRLLAPASMEISDVFIEAYGDCQTFECEHS